MDGVDPFQANVGEARRSSLSNGGYALSEVGGLAEEVLRLASATYSAVVSWATEATDDDQRAGHDPAEDLQALHQLRGHLAAAAVTAGELARVEVCREPHGLD